MNTIYGVTFDHKGETPGLGAEINTTKFESMFTDKKLFENGKFVSIQVHKGGADPSDIHGVDAISGGTITSKGLEKMLLDCLKKYDDYLIKNAI
jgi:Na+-transporting NADH:ubiquinone oxidoreductase subunit C